MIIGFFPCLNIRPNIRAVCARLCAVCARLCRICASPARHYDVRKKATGKDFDAVMYQPHITMIEAARIFGWNYPKFKKSSLRGFPGALATNLLEGKKLPHPGGRYGVRHQYQHRED